MKRRDFVASLSFLNNYFANPPLAALEVLLPKDGTQLTQVMDGQGRKLPTVNEAEDLFNVIGVRIPIRKSVTLRFE